MHINVVELVTQPMEEKTGDLFRGWTDLAENRKVVEILVVKLAEQFLGVVFENLEVNSQPGRIQFLSANGDLDVPIVAMQVFAVTLVVHKPVGRSKVRLDGKMIHEAKVSNNLIY